MAEIKATADTDFKNMLKDILRDRLICGINNKMIQKWLLAEVANAMDKKCRNVVYRTK